MTSKKIKYTIDDAPYIPAALSAFCNAHKTREYILKGKNGEIDKIVDISKKMRKFLESEGVQVFESVTSIRYSPKRELPLIDPGTKEAVITPVEIKGKNPTNYKANGLIITVVVSGADVKEMKVNQRKLEDMLTTYAAKFGVPPARICAESELKCVYKFAKADDGGQACSVK